MNQNQLKEEKKKWICRYTDLGANESIIKFIGEILFHGATVNNYDDSVKTITNLFANGYCYYLAKMLQDAFPNGTICQCYPFGHIVYVYKGIAYDIDGVSSSECEMCIPISLLGESVNDFRHIPDKEYYTTDQEIANIGIKCKEKHLYLDALFYQDLVQIKENEFIFDL